MKRSEFKQMIKEAINEASIPKSIAKRYIDAYTDGGPEESQKVIADEFGDRDDWYDINADIEDIIYAVMKKLEPKIAKMIKELL